MSQALQIASLMVVDINNSHPFLSQRLQAISKSGALRISTIENDNNIGITAEKIGDNIVCPR
jgi:hypothetical protein